MSLHVVVVPLVCFLVLVLPGLAVGVVAGIRTGTAIATAPLITYGLVTVTATAASYLSFSWRPLTLVLVTLIACAAIVAVRLVAGRGVPMQRRLHMERPTRPAWRDWVVAAGVAAGGVLSAGVLLKGFGSLGAPNQDWDYVYHAQAVRLIADSGDLAPQAMSRVNDWESTSFYYPNTFHGVAAIVRDLTGASVFEVLNSSSMIVCLVAGLGLAGLLHRLRAPLVVTACTPVLLAGFASFPYDLLWRGPLLPYAAGVAVIPALVALLDVALVGRRKIVVLLFGVSAAGMLGLHPSTALSAAIFIAAYLVVRWFRSPRSIGRDLVVLAAAGTMAIIAALPGVKGAIATGSGGPTLDWPAVMSPGQAVGDLLLLNHEAPAPQYWLAMLLVVGLLTLYRARYLWAWVGGAGITFILFVMATSSDGPLTEELTRPWWNDRWRFAALAVLGFAPLAAHGLWSLALLAQRVVRRVLESRVSLPRRAVTGACVLLGLLAIFTLSNGLYAPRNSGRVAISYQTDRLLNANETAAMTWLAQHSTGGSIMNDANDGSAYLSAVAGLHPLFGSIVEPRLVPNMGPTQQLLIEHFNCLDSDPAVRRAIKDLDVRYVFLGSGFIRPDYTRLPGLVGIASSPSVRLIHTGPGVQIFAVQLSSAPEAPISACTEAPRGGSAG